MAIPYALTFGSVTTSDRLVAPDNASINDLLPWSTVQWLYPTTFTANRRLHSKLAAQGGNGNFVLLGATGTLIGDVVRATTRATYTTSTLMELNTWNFICSTYDETDGARVFMGTLNRPPMEAAYSARNAGAGATGTNTGTGLGQAVCNGNFAPWARAFQGRCAYFALMKYQLLLPDVLKWYRTGVPSVPEVRLLFPRIGSSGSGLVRDESGYGNHGTITGAIPTSDLLPLVSPDYHQPNRRYWDLGAKAHQLLVNQAVNRAATF